MHGNISQPGQNNAIERQQKAQREEKAKKAGYQINWKKFGLLIGSIVLILATIVMSWWFFWGREKKDGSEKVYDVVVTLKDQTQKDPEEDMRSSLKAGDVILARETGQKWSNTERISYLIIKMELKESEVIKLTEPKTKKLSEKEAKEKGLIRDNSKNESEMDKEELEQQLTRTVRARKYRIKIEEMDFDPAKVREGQPFPDEEFGWEIVERK